MRSAVFACLLATVDGANKECQKVVYPYAFGANSPYHAAGASVGTAGHLACDSSEPAVLTEVDGTQNCPDDTAATCRTACCHAAAKCSTTYEDVGDGTALVDCPADTVLFPNELCYTVSASTSAACGAQATSSTFDVDIDKAHCCRTKCNKAAKGFELFTSNPTSGMQMCPETGGTYQVSTSKYCATSTCAASDKNTCCRKKCSSGVVLNGEATDAADVDVACASADADKISTDAFCTGATCTTSDTQCCLNKCSEGYEAFGGSTEGYKQCAENLVVSSDNYCSGPTCSTSDKEQCCLTKCTAEKGFELAGMKTKDKKQCAKDLRVHPTGTCKATSCSASSSVCCQQKCSKGFKLKGAAGSGTECGKDLTVSTTAYCAGSSCAASDAGTCCQQKCSKGYKLNGATTNEANTCGKDTTLASDGKCVGSPCAATDSKICCNEKCTDKKTGFKVHKGTGKEPNECKKGELVSSKGVCKGDCSSDDAKTCCLSANNSTATTDARGVGLAAAVGMLVVMAVAA